MPSRRATTAAVFGIITSGVHVATITRSMSSGDSPLPASALPAAATAMSATVSSGPAMRLLAIPTLLRIHSSLVSTVAASSSLVTILAGWYPPNARTRAPTEPSWSRIGLVSSLGSGVGCWVEPDERLARIDGITVLDQPLENRGGEARSHQVAVAAHFYPAEFGAAANFGAWLTGSGNRAKRAALRGDDEPPFGCVTVGVNVVLGEQRHGRLQVIWRLHRECLGSRHSSPCKAHQRACWREFDEGGSSKAGHCLHAFVPPDRCTDLCADPLEPVGTASHRSSVAV